MRFACDIDRVGLFDEEEEKEKEEGVASIGGCK